MKTKIIENKAVIAVALVLLLTVSVFALTAPTVIAHDPPWNVPTYAYVSASPDTVGVGQYTALIMWLDKFPATAGGAGGDLWRGYTLDITKPDGSKEQLGPFTSSQIGGAWTIYTPDQVGNYTIVFSWPGQTLTNGTGTPRISPYTGDYFMPATSAPITLTVTQDNVAEWQEPSLPDYWTRPIPTTNRNWAQLASNWLGSSWLVNDFQRWGQAPNSAHILYTRPIINGGIADASFGAVKYDTTDYENFFPDPILMSGKIYYNAGTYPNYGYYCVDLQSGELVWYKNGTDNGLNNPVVNQIYQGLGGAGVYTGETYPQLSFGQLYSYYSLNGAGILNHLWITQGSTWYMLDANTGNWILTLTNVPGGTAITDQDGSLLRYTYNSAAGQFLAWNVSQSLPPPSPTGTGQAQWEPRQGATIDAVNDTTWTKFGTRTGTSPIDANDIRPRSGYTMNVTGPAGLPSLSAVLQDENRVPRLMLFSDFKNSPSFGSSDMTIDLAVVRIDYHTAPYSPLPDKTFSQNNNLGYGVTLLWNTTITKPLAGNLTFSLGSLSYEDNVFTIDCKETMQTWGYSLETGEQIWGPTEPHGAWDVYGMSDNVAYNRIYKCGYDGTLYCYDIKTGTLMWTYNAAGIGYESPYGDYPLSIGGIADGKVYLYSTEHSPTQPMWRGSYLRCVDAYSGEELWKSLNFVSGMSIADGCIVAGNHYDNQMYVYGKGPSAIAVTASPKVVAHGNSVLIEGTVTDQSSGAKGTPAISDEDMDAWMEYLYMKQEIPATAKGVQVQLTAFDANGNSVDLGYVTSDRTGLFKKMWQPPSEGEYIIIATFEGSNSYGASYAETAIGVTTATQSTLPTQPPTQPTQTPETPHTSTAPTTPAVVPEPDSGFPTETVLIIAAAVIIIVVIAAIAAVLSKHNTSSKITRKNNQSLTAAKPYVPFHFPLFSKPN